MPNVTPFSPITTGNAARKPATWTPIMPVPLDAPPPPASHPKLGMPAARWAYLSAEGATLGYVLRFNAPTVEDPRAKEFRPLVFARHPNGGFVEWRWLGFPEPRPLYRLDQMTTRAAAPVLLCEGEKAADAAQKLAPGYVTTTTSGGAKGSAKADWRPLRGRRVTIWPDADAAGADYARDVARALYAAGALEVRVVSPPPNCAIGWDAADALADGFDEAQVGRLIEAAKPADGTRPKASGRETTGPRRRTPQRDILIDLADGCEFWHDALREPFVTYPVDQHRESWRLRSSEFRSWLATKFFDETGGAIGSQALEDGLRILEARCGKGAEYSHYVRIGVHRDRLYYDLCDIHWRAIECTPNGWSIVDRVPIKFLRSKAMRPQVEPEAGGMIEELRGFLNVAEPDFKLVIGWLVAALRERGPFPILLAHGEHGAGKSFFCRLLRSLIDPSAAPIRSIPKDDQNLILSATNSWVLAFDNLSGVAAWLADGLCRIASGDGFAIKKLYTDNEEMIFTAMRPVMANGIPRLAERADLGDRALVVRLQTIEAADRLPERELWARWEAAKPRILAALLDAVCGALRSLDRVRIAEYPRMADFLQFVSAASPALGWDDDEFFAAYKGNQAEVSENAFEADGVAVAIWQFITTQEPSGWEGSAAQLLVAVGALTTDAQRSSRSWPRSASAMGNRFDRVAPLLRSQGLICERRRGRDGSRLLVIVPEKHGPPPPGT